MEVVSAAALDGSLEAPSPALDRSLRTRRRLAYLSWVVVGGIGTYVDKIHEAAGVVAYPNARWVGERFFVSPVYVGAGLGMFVLYTLVVGHHRGRQGVLGGRPLRVIDFAAALGFWMAAYQGSALLGAPERTRTAWPYALAGGLVAWAIPPLWRGRRSALPMYAALVAVLGTGFEWMATRSGGFAYPVCPSHACLGATVPLVWLPALYLHAALFVHRMMGGTRAARRALVHAVTKAAAPPPGTPGHPPSGSSA
ncbi:MAG TPA: hypothetical protein VND93_25320 [Myxococcales bacterium]|nr:hypothetical protein [Myxococcales bacterium]